MELSHEAQEILERMWVEITEHNRTPDLSVLKDNDAFRELVESGYIKTEAEQVLTEKGLEEGRLCVRRHRLAERLLADVLHTKGKMIHEKGCQLEHMLHKGLEDNICILLGHPNSCPHGRSIPRGRCCRRHVRRTESMVIPLSELQKGQNGKIAYVHTTDEGILNKIMAMGALPGRFVTLVQKFPSFVFKMGQSQFAVDQNLANQIKVWVLRK